MTTSTITGPIVDPALGPLANREVIITLVAGTGNMAHHASGEIMSRWETRTDDAGDFSVELPWNTEISSPSGTFYRATIGIGSRAAVRTFALDPARGVTAGGSYPLGDDRVVVVSPPPPDFAPVKGDTGPQGPTGPAGAQGADGPAGSTATVTVGTTTTGDAGTDAAVTNSGTTSAAVLDFTIPRGDTGPAGPTQGLAHASAQVQVAGIGTTAVPVPGVSIAFTAPTDRPSTIRAVIPKVGCQTLGGIVTVQLRDEDGTVTATDSFRGQQAGNNSYGTCCIVEPVEAGAGDIVRQMWAVCSTTNGFLNLVGNQPATASYIDLEAYAH